MYQKTGWTNFNELWVTDSTLNEGTISLVTSKLGCKRWFIVCHCTASAIKLAMTGTYLGMVAPISSIVGMYINSI